MATATAEVRLTLRDKLKSGLDSARQNLNRNVNSMQTKLNSLKSSSMDTLSSIGANIPGVGGAFAGLVNPISIATTAVLGLATATVSAIQKANQWHEKMAEINVTAELTKEGLKGLSDQLLEVGSRNSVALDEIPKAYGRIISAGLSVKQSLVALEPTVRAAKAGFTDMETTAGAGIATMMSSGENINKVYDILFETVKEGNAEFKDIARYLPKIIPMARNVGFALDETAGAYAALTTKLSAEQSTTALEGIMRSLSNQKNLKKFKSMGVEVFDVNTGQVKPILEIIKQVEGAMAGLTDSQRTLKFGSLGLDDMSKLGFSTLIQDVTGLEKAINATVNSQGALDKAYQDSLTPMEQWRIVMNQLQVYAIKFGELFLPIISELGQKVLSVINYFKELYAESELFRGLLDVIGWLSKQVWNAMTIGIKAVWKILGWLIDGVKGLFGWIGGLIRKVTGFTGSWESAWLKIKPIFIWMKELLGSISEIMDDVFNFRFAEAKKKISDFEFPNLEEITARVMLDAQTKSDTDLLDDDPSNPINPTAPTVPVNDDLTTIKGGGQSKNLTVNIDSFVKNLSSQNEEINKMSIKEIERVFTEMFMKVTRSVELEF